jgi:hypothetical protein
MDYTMRFVQALFSYFSEMDEEKSIYLYIYDTLHQEYFFIPNIYYI